MLSRLLLGLINVLPRWVVLKLAAAFGLLIYFVSKVTPYRDALERNIRTAFPTRFSEREVSRMARKHAKDLFKTMVETARFRELPRLLEQGRIRVEGLENLDAALAEGKGAVVLSAHMGNWELLIALLGLLGYKGHAVVIRQSNVGFNRWLVRERERFGTKVHYTGEVSSGEIQRLLAQNEIVILLADHHAYGSKARNIVEFFGKPVSVPAGPVVYPLRTGAALVPAYSIRLRDHSHRVIVEPPLPLDDTGDPERDFQTNCRRYIEVFERWIEKHPDQWMWSHERWEWLDENLEPKG